MLLTNHLIIRSHNLPFIAEVWRCSSFKKDLRGPILFFCTGHAKENQIPKKCIHFFTDLLLHFVKLGYLSALPKLEGTFMAGRLLSKSTEMLLIFLFITLRCTEICNVNNGRP